MWSPPHILPITDRLDYTCRQSYTLAVDMSSQRPAKTIGDQELALLRFVGNEGHATVARAAAGFGKSRGLARSTVLTMMERLRKKGYLTRRQVAGVYHYAPRSAPSMTLLDAVRRFVDRTLGGSIGPFVAYLSERERLSEKELTDLEAVLAKLQPQRRKNE